MELSGKVAMVTGASQGVGRAYALALAQAGATVVASSRSMGAPAAGEAPHEDSLAETARLASGLGRPLHPMVCDVGREDHIVRAMDEVIGAYGRIDILVNNAATYPGAQPGKNMDPLAYGVPDWHLYFGVNVIGPYLLTKAAAPHMMAQRSGSIINISSPAGHMVVYDADDIRHKGMLGYGVSKAAIDRMSLFFASELAPYGIAVNSLSPGAVITKSWGLIPPEKLAQVRAAGLAREPTAEVMGPSIVFMAQQTASTLTGQILETDDFGKKWGAN